MMPKSSNQGTHPSNVGSTVKDMDVRLGGHSISEPKKREKPRDGREGGREGGRERGRE